MCKLVNLDIDDRQIQVAEIKKDYIQNIITCIRLCPDIERVVLFGSALEERCTDFSDIDIAVFGKQSKTKMLKLQSYRNFVDSIVSFGVIQDYDILYFEMQKENRGKFMKEIESGVVLYERV